MVNTVVAAILTYNSKVLCMQRGHSKYDYMSFKYEFPGGKMEIGETPPMALTREIKEEINLDIQVDETNHFITINHTYPDFSLKLIAYKCYLKSDKITRREHISHVWLPVDKLKTIEWAEADYPIIEKLIDIGV